MLYALHSRQRAEEEIAGISLRLCLTKKKEMKRNEMKQKRHADTVRCTRVMLSNHKGGFPESGSNPVKRQQCSNVSPIIERKIQGCGRLLIMLV